MKSFYLELNAFIGAGKKILKIDSSKAFVYTSSWSLVEQFININEKNFEIIKSNLLTIKESGIYIDKNDIVKKVLDAFDISIPFYSTNNDYLLDIMNKIIINNKYKDIDENTIHNLVKLQDIRKLSNSLNTKLYKEFMNVARNIINTEFDENLWYIMVFELLVKMVQDNTNKPIEQIMKGYNGSLDRFIYASAQYYGKLHKTDRNDYIDLEHYKYINNDITYMVSDDKIMKFFDKKRVYTVDQFLEYMK